MFSPSSCVESPSLQPRLHRHRHNEALLCCDGICNGYKLSYTYVLVGCFASTRHQRLQSAIAPLHTEPSCTGAFKFTKSFAATSIMAQSLETVLVTTDSALQEPQVMVYADQNLTSVDDYITADFNPATGALVLQPWHGVKVCWGRASC